MFVREIDIPIYRLAEQILEMLSRPMDRDNGTITKDDSYSNVSRIESSFARTFDLVFLVL